MNNMSISKKKIRKTRRRSHPVASFLLALMVVVAVISCGVQECGREGNQSASGTPMETDLKITVLDVGQGLSVLAENDGHFLLYDGGGGEKSDYVVAYLAERGCSKLDYLIASHYDGDHISGLVGCLYQYPVDTVICPDYSTGKDIQTAFEKALKINKAKTVHPQAGEEFAFGGATLKVLAAEEYSAGDDNNSSLVLQICYGGFKYLLTGDAEWGTEKMLLEAGVSLASDVYVAGHHGSASSSGWDFVDAVSPKAAVISCGAGNDYGHPAESTLRVLEEQDLDLYRTDKQGEIICTTNGVEFSMNVDPCRDYSAGSSGGLALFGQGDQSGQSSADSKHYVVNTKSNKFHLPDCSAILKMNQKNRLEVEASRGDLIRNGCEPCGYCKP